MSAMRVTMVGASLILALSSCGAGKRGAHSGSATDRSRSGAGGPSAVCAELNPHHFGACQASLEVTEEVHRLLVAGAMHATSSSACYDGPGQRVELAEVLVCKSRETSKKLVVSASYRVVLHPEGDTRGCRKPADCAWLKPKSSRHCVELEFGGPDDLLIIAPPSSLPGLAGTPLDQVHNGDCYGESGPFVPRPLGAVANPAL